jgi:hypothetical protein
MVLVGFPREDIEEGGQLVLLFVFWGTLLVNWGGLGGGAPCNVIGWTNWAMDMCEGRGVWSKGRLRDELFA